ncbi:ead/Ea22-like family protein [Enterobacter quasimori]|uniref:ead/Ea22-like family protein n=1 Tax=Enterobacter quasimori TaxID=2838947 RepID=UPI001C0C0EDD|nr:ead/Ea22-like family protein [Enterobacter quasimori]MBT1727140.1 ead/Ea22-like family protein [Enterobacter quasimori]
MSSIDKRALREAAEKTGADEWCAFIDTKSKTYSVHTPGDNRCGDVVKWAGFDGQQRAAAKAMFIAAANPATVLALLDELEAAENRIAEVESQRRMAFMACNRWADKFREAEKRIADLSHHLQCAHGFIEHTEAFGHEASNGILCCGDAQWDIDASKSALAAAAKGE